MSTLYGSGAMGGAVNIITKKTNKNSYNLNVNLDNGPKAAYKKIQLSLNLLCWKKSLG